jgi:hypothetical protein
VESAGVVADAVVVYLADHDEVVVDLSGVRGVPSSFFNVLLLRVAEAFGAAALDSRVRFTLDSDAQQDVLNRSLSAARAMTS